MQKLSHPSAAVILVSLALSGCGKDSSRSPADSAHAQVATIPAATSETHSASSADSCPHNGLWARCSVERRLRQSGFVAIPSAAAGDRRPGFSVKPIVYTLAGNRLELFLYQNENAANRDLANLDTLRVAPKGSVLADTASRPVLIRSVNLAAVFFGGNPDHIERLQLAITAGPPQPGSSR